MSTSEERLPPSHSMALAIADAFLAHSHPFFERTGFDLESSKELAVRHIPGFVVSVTTRILALELYLKSLVGLRIGAPPKTHNVLRLFNLLPEDTKDQIIARFEARRCRTPWRATSFHLRLVVLGREPPSGSGETQEGDSNLTLKQVLHRAQHAFQNFRYLHEAGRPGEYVDLVYDFEPLEVIASICRELVVNELAERPHPCPISYPVGDWSAHCGSYAFQPPTWVLPDI